MKEYDKRKGHRSSKLHVIYISSNNVRHPVTKTFTSLHPTTLNYTCRHFTSSYLNFTQLNFTTLSFGSTQFKSPTAPLHLTSLHFTSLHFILSFQVLILCLWTSVCRPRPLICTKYIHSKLQSSSLTLFHCLGRFHSAWLSRGHHLGSRWQDVGL